MNDENTGENNLIIKCEDIQDLLFEYAERELGESRSALVREHLLHCEKCQESFREIMNTVSVLQNAVTPDNQLPDKLSDKHYTRLIRAVTHPVLDWIFEHHMLMSFIAVITVLILTIIALQTVRILKSLEMENLDNGFEVYIDAPGTATNNSTIIHWHREHYEQ